MSTTLQRIGDAFRSVYAPAVRSYDRLKQKRRNRLTARIKEEKRRLQGYSLGQRIMATVAGAYFPSAGSVAVIAVVLGFAVAVILYADGRTARTEIPVLTRLTNIETAIALIFIPITIFVVGLSSRRSSGGVTVAEILLRSVHLFPLTILIIGIVASFALITNAGLALVFIGITFLLSGYCIFQIIRLLLDEPSLHRAGIGLLQDTVRRSINLALDERIGKNLALRALENLPIDYSPFSIGEDPGTTYAIRTTQEGFVQDMSLDRLQQFAMELEKCANSNGFAYGEKRVLESAFAAEEPCVDEGTSRKLNVEKHRYVKKLYADQITSDSNVLVTFPRALVPNKRDRERLTVIARRAFTIKPRESYSERISKYLGEVKDHALVALRDRRTSSLESLLDAFVSVAEAFLAEMRRAGGGYSFEQAQNEEAALITGGWNEVRWIFDHLAEIHHVGCRSGDMKVASLVAAPPFRIAFAAIRARDHLLFREFTRFTFRFYDAALVEKDRKMREYLVDRAWRHLRELGNFGVQMQLERTGNEAESLETLIDFGTTLLLRYQDLLKTAFDSRQLADFRTFTNGAIELFQRLLSPHTAYVSPASLTARLSEPGLSKEDQQNVRDQLKRRQVLENAYEKFLVRRSQMFFGLGAYVFERQIANPKDTTVSDFLNQISGLVPSAPRELSELYLSVRDFKILNLWGWEWWGAPEEGPWHGNLFQGTTMYYCFHLARLCQTLSGEQIIGLSFPKCETFTDDVSERGVITTTLKSFSSDRGKWRDVIPDAWLPRIESVGVALKRLVDQKAREGEDLLIAAELNPDLLEKFRSSFKQTFLSNAGIRRVFIEQNAYTDESSTLPREKNKLQWGLNQMEDKRFYVGKGIDSGLGERHGEDLGLSESQFAFGEMLKLLPECEVKPGETTEDIISRAIVELRDGGYVASAVFTDLAVPRQMSLENSSSFTAAWRLDVQLRKNPGFSGFFHFEARKIPVYAVWGTDAKNRACVMALRECMEWVQQSPIDDDSEISLVDGLFSIRFADLAKEDELRTQVLSQPPPWLREQKDPDRYLRTRVWLRISERFEITLKQADAGRRFIIRD
jgi:hypothetical protein